MASASANLQSSPVIHLIDPSVKDRFWQVVEDCLIQFHQFAVLAAIQQTRSERQSVESCPPDILGDVIYHGEPFYVACDMAGIAEISEQERLLAVHQAAYQVIRKRQGW